jgi:hypothetical protein
MRFHRRRYFFPQPLDSVYTDLLSRRFKHLSRDPFRGTSMDLK